MSGGYEILSHPSDVGFRAWGPDWPTALAHSVAALASIITGEYPPTAAMSREVVVEADDPESLVVKLLEEVLYRVDTQDWLASWARVELSDGKAVGKLQGAPLDRRARAEGVHVKAITWHQLEAVEDDDGVRIRVFVDL